jgi:hypothetical protein
LEKFKGVFVKIPSPGDFLEFEINYFYIRKDLEINKKRQGQICKKFGISSNKEIFF